MGIRGMSDCLVQLCRQLEGLSLRQLVKLLYSFNLPMCSIDFRDLPHMWGEESYKNHTEEEMKDVVLDVWYSSINDMTKEEAVDEMAHLVIDLLRVVRS